MACVKKRKYKNGFRYVLDFYDNDNKRQRITMKAGTSKKAASDRLREIEDQLSKGLYRPEKEIPNFNTVVKDWLDQKKLNVRASYWSVCEGITRNHFNEFQSLKVSRILTADVEKWIATRQKDGMHIDTLRKCLMILGQIMGYAVRHRYIAFNPVKEAERPREQGNVKKEKIKVLSADQIKSLLDKTDDLKYRTLFMLAIMSGARQGELLGLKWSDIDWDNSQVHIQRTYNNQQWYDVKTATSNRKIDLGPAMITALKKWKLACPKSRLNLIFPNGDGGPIDHNNLRVRNYIPALEKAKISPIRFHDLRHTYASLLIDQGENIKYIQTQLGHSTPTVTLNVYAHLMKPVNQAAAIRLEKAIF